MLEELFVKEGSQERRWIVLEMLGTPGMLTLEGEEMPPLPPGCKALSSRVSPNGLHDVMIEVDSELALIALARWYSPDDWQEWLIDMRGWTV